MAKQADQYFKIDPWRIIEEGFDKSYSMVAESIFSIGNEHMGVRGNFEEGYSGETLQGSYFNGIYARTVVGKTGYKGIVTVGEFMVNSVNWLKAKITVDNETLDLESSDFSGFERVLDMRTGLLTRKLIWKTKSGKETQITFERFLSMPRRTIGAQKITLKPLNYDGEIEVELWSDFEVIHQSVLKNFWEVLDKKHDTDSFEIRGQVEETGKIVDSYSYVKLKGTGKSEDLENEKAVGKRFVIDVKKNEETSLIRLVSNDYNPADEQMKKFLKESSFEQLLNESIAWWSDTWTKSDIVIEGDEENQQGIRFCIFQMMQTYHGARPGNNIGAKGLSGEAYGGCAFWDTETYCLPFYIFNNMAAAKDLLLFRYNTLDEARKRARDLDCDGAFYPISTISGKETCPLWQHASLQLQASTGVAYGVWFYEKLSNDESFMEDYGMEMLIEISRMLATRGDWTADGKNYGFFCVMGPDEFQMMVNHNCYTNYMGRFTFEYAVDTWKKLQTNSPETCERLKKQLNFSEKEIEDWSNKAEHMLIIKDEKTQLYEQHEGFFKLPHVDINQIPITDFPLYSHWTYDRIYRNDMIKQPDVLMMLLMFNSSFTEEELRANYEYYEPKCIHESSLSPSVHSILAAQLKKSEEATKFFSFATRMDLDNYNRNTNEGLHTTSIAAGWMNIVYGFGGMRSDGGILSFTPTIPQNWNSYSFHVTYLDKVIELNAKKDHINISLLDENGSVKVRVYGKEYELTNKTIEIPVPEEWRI